MAAFELTVRTAVRGYHVYKEVWAPAIGEEFVYGGMGALQLVVAWAEASGTVEIYGLG